MLSVCFNLGQLILDLELILNIPIIFLGQVLEYVVKNSAKLIPMRTNKAIRNAILNIFFLSPSLG